MRCGDCQGDFGHLYSATKTGKFLCQKKHKERKTTLRKTNFKRTSALRVTYSTIFFCGTCFFAPFFFTPLNCCLGLIFHCYEQFVFRRVAQDPRKRGCMFVRWCRLFSSPDVSYPSDFYSMDFEGRI
ncbi:hypothetical protein CEXT_411831 [Caerostris extrusa]|uniref:Uncharacterized protein n=1 Tax=Caerostris extrusa TaxID=172846 RepID=A0AAV4SPW2_CAEEX|nr:hypothetical protein CEXT_411831 [Caerostris extrusa]